MKHKIGWLLYALVLICVAVPLLWARGLFLPPCHDRTETVRFADGTSVSLALAKARFTATDGSSPAWESEPGWHVQDYLTMDIDRDDAAELLLLVWRRGNYGPSRPFWVKHNDTQWSQHIFIYDRRDGIFVPQWMSSQLRPKVVRWAVASTDELFILTPDGDKTLWQWGQWGLVRTDTPL